MKQYDNAQLTPMERELLQKATLYQQMADQCLATLDHSIAQREQQEAKWNDIEAVKARYDELGKMVPGTQPSGDYLNPIPYEVGMTVTVGLFYTDGDDIWECIKTGAPSGFDDKAYFDIIG